MRQNTNIYTHVWFTILWIISRWMEVLIQCKWLIFWVNLVILIRRKMLNSCLSQSIISIWIMDWKLLKKLWVVINRVDLMNKQILMNLKVWCLAQMCMMFKYLHLNKVRIAHFIEIGRQHSVKVKFYWHNHRVGRRYILLGPCSSSIIKVIEI